MNKIESKQTKDLIADQIKNLVYTGKLKDGDEITQNEIAEVLGLSRMPVREAFQSLCAEGILTRLENRHVRVNGLNREKCRAIFSAFVGLEKGLSPFVDYSLLDTGNEYSWHLSYAKSTHNPIVVSNINTIISGYISYFLIQNRNEKRLEILKKIDAENKTILFDQYLEALLNDLEGAVIC